MVKKKYTSKRTTLKDKYKIQKRVVEHNRKQRKQAKRDAKNGIKKHNKKKDPGIPNSWPFKKQLLDEIAQAKERAERLAEEGKLKKKKERTVEDLMREAEASRVDFNSRRGLPMDPHHTTTTQQQQQPPPQPTSSRRTYVRELKKVIEASDVILEILDARDPIGTRISSATENGILSVPDKKLVLILNKIDLVPKDAVAGWLAHLRRSHPCIAVRAGISGHNKSVGQQQVSATGNLEESGNNAVGMEGLLQLLKNYARSHGTSTKTCITVGIIGYPNVGKSSLVNSLKRQRAVGVSPRAGFTTSAQEVVLDKTVRLYDSPGVVFSDEGDDDAVLKNGVVLDNVGDPYEAVKALVARCSVETLMMTYALPRFNDVDMFLSMVAKKYGKVGRGGIPDKVAAGKCVLKDWNTGKIKYYTPVPEMTAVEEKTTAVSRGSATIVSSFGKEFDVCDDDAVIDTLEETDEFDFVRLERGRRMEKNVLDESMDDSDDGETGKEEQTDGDSQMMDVEKTAVYKNDKVADAEDFDFASM